ncbi:DUF2184 domain-containing protein [Desulfovibrio sp. OttesenSCG-928-C14]|nr:DUF2184 domain-containing protein [Desulfovibrio sp. OttesenSCG-928-C14]
MAKITKPLLHLKPRQVRPFSMDGATMEDLAMLGLQFPADKLDSLMEAYGNALRAHSMDAAPAAGPGTVSLASAGVPVQFLQTLLPGTVRTVTAARKIDKLIGRTIAGKWQDEEVVQIVVELLGRARPYGDYAAGPLANFKVDFERRTVVRFEQDLEVKALEEARAAEIRQNSGELKRAAVAQSLAIEHNRVGFYGYNDGECRTYGYLNDPGLPNYQTVPAGGSGSTKFQDKTFAEITEDFLLAASTLRTRTGEAVDPDETPCTLAIAAAAREFLNVTNDHGVSVKQWLKENYPNWKIDSAPELDGANGGQNVFYLHADEVPGPDESGSQKVVEQYVQAVLRLLGVERKAKGIYEAYSSATAGVMWKAPFAVVRYSGI